MALRRSLPRRAFLSASARAAVGIAAASSMTCAGSTPQQAEVGAQGLIADLERQIPRLMADTALPGLSIALVRGARVMWARGFGVSDNASTTPVDVETVFEAASMSKPVFAYAVMKLSERGVLDLDTPLTSYTPDRLLVGDVRLDRITARHVLSHTSGLQDWRSGSAPLSIHFTPGTQWMYSGEGYAYLQSIVTRLTGHVNSDVCATYEADVRVCATDIDDYLRANLLVPFGMNLSGYVWNDRLAAHAARPHDERGAPLEKSHPSATDAARYASAGGLHATSSDYAKFLIEVMDPKPPDAFRLSRASIDQMLRPAIKLGDGSRPSSWALGWQVLHTPEGDVVAHGGDNRGFHSYAAMSVSRKSGVVIMTNSESGAKVVETFVSESWLRRLLLE